MEVPLETRDRPNLLFGRNVFRQRDPNDGFFFIFFLYFLFFLPSESIPKLEQGLSDQTIKRGQELILRCAFSGQPNITLVWNINQQYLRTDHHRIVTSEVMTEHKAVSTLLVKRVTDKEAGEISCVAWYPTLQSVSVKSTALVDVLGRMFFVFFFYFRMWKLYIFASTSKAL